MKRLFLIAGLVGLLGACAPEIPPLNFGVPDVGPTATKIDAEVKTITVTIAGDNQKTGRIVPIADYASPIWRDSLEDAFNRMAIFKDEAQRKISVSVVIMQLDVPATGIDMDSTVTAKYELIDRATGGIIYTQNFTTKGQTKLEWGLQPPIARSRDSLNHAVQANITQFLQALQTVDITKPMFPAKSG
jgi:hypothetical protein